MDQNVTLFCRMLPRKDKFVAQCNTPAGGGAPWPIHRAIQVPFTSLTFFLLSINVLKIVVPHLSSLLLNLFDISAVKKNNCLLMYVTATNILSVFLSIMII